MNVYRKKSIDLYRELSQTVSINSVEVTTFDSTFLWSSVYSQRDLDRNSVVRYRVGGTVVYKEGCAITNTHHLATELHNEKLFSRSPCGKFTAVVREVKIKDATQQFLEIWDASKKIKSIDLKSEDHHDLVHSNASFGCLRWSHDSKKILYVAERKVKKSVSYFKNSGKEDDISSRGDQFVYQDSWGEQLLTSKCPSLYILDVSAEEIIDFDEVISEDISVHDPVWSKDDKCVLFGGFQNKPFRLGFIYCKNRPSSIYSVNVGSKILEKIIGDDSQCLFSPTFSPSGDKLIYLATAPFGPHVQCSKLMVASVSSSKDGPSFDSPKILVNTVPNQESLDDFTGLYMNGIRKNNWLINGHQLVVTSVHRSNTCILLIDISNGRVEILEKSGDWQVFRVCNDKIFATYQTPNSPAALKCGSLSNSKLHWVDLSTPNKDLPDISWQILQFKPDLVNEQYPELSYETVLYTPKNSPPLGLIVNPHGGPHSCYVAGFNMEAAFWCSLGYAVARVNYRGSIGFGQDNIYSLPGRVGTQDVHDVQQAAVFVKDMLNVSDNNVFVTGGSHGGFLTLHLIGQYPSFYAASATRNPVCSLLANLEGSDITDWAFCEGGFPYYYDSTMNSEVVSKLYDASPIRYAPDVRTPLLLLLGEIDKRVPPFQSHNYYRILKSRGVNVKILNYPDNNHPISKVDAEADSAMNTVLWFFEHSSRCNERN